MNLQDVLTTDLSKVENPETFIEMALKFQQMMMLYDAGIQEIKTKLEILNRECRITCEHNPIESIKSRVKDPKSIAKKMKKNGWKMTFESMVENLNDIAGIRIICPFIDDIYRVADMIIKQDDITLVRIKDYIKNPKPNGYRSLHLILEVPIFLSDSKQMVRVEVQLRTIAMDFWASLEHQLRYKAENHIPQHIVQDLKDCADVITQTDIKMQQIAKELDRIEKA